MIRNSIDELIKESIKNKDTTRTNTLRSIKNEFLKFKTSPNFKEFKDSDEVAILKNMYDSREQSYNIYLSANRNDLAINEMSEMTIIKEFLPKPITKETIIEFLDNNGYLSIDKKSMGNVIKEVKSNLLGVDGKLVADIVKSRLV